MTQEQIASNNVHLRPRSQYSITPSIVLRVIEYTADNEEIPAAYSHKFRRPYLPLAVLEYNIANNPFPGVSGLNIDIVHEMTEANYAATFSFDMAAVLNDSLTLTMLYSILKDNPSDLDYIYRLAEMLPDECWLQPGEKLVNNPAYVAAINNNKYRLLMLERR